MTNLGAFGFELLVKSLEFLDTDPDPGPGLLLAPSTQIDSSTVAIQKCKIVVPQSAFLKPSTST
jgi:hypothetical protein